MNRSLPRRSKSDFVHLALVAFILALFINPEITQAQQNRPQASQPNDKEYSESIRTNTTEKFFLTELVDHLPASDKVPTPAKILGYPIGTPNKLTYTKDQYRYYRELEK